MQYVLIVILAIVVVFIIIVVTRPPGFRVVRSIGISAPAAVVFEQVNDFHKWQAWSPWEKIDPNLQRTYEGPPAGAGTVYSWKGNKRVGEGRMTMIESRPAELIGIRLDFLKPFRSTNTAEFTFKPNGEQTDVTWTMMGKSNFISKAFCMFMDMDKMIGKEFEKGLAQLKAVVESSPRA